MQQSSGPHPDDSRYDTTSTPSAPAFRLASFRCLCVRSHVRAFFTRIVVRPTPATPPTAISIGEHMFHRVIYWLILCIIQIELERVVPTASLASTSVRVVGVARALPYAAHREPSCERCVRQVEPHARRAHARTATVSANLHAGTYAM